jgi:glucans biosynthesis protein
MADNPMHPAEEPEHLRDAPRCGARTRSGEPCCSPAMPNGRCRMHGGASPGAPTGERNGNYKHGRFTREAIEARKFIRALVAQMLAMAASIPKT